MSQEPEVPNMSTRTIQGFFYGLFMDEDVLVSYDVVPRGARRAYVDNFKLHIGKRATLWPSAGDRAYGVVYSLTQAELDFLYSGSEFTDYRPESVIAINMDGSESIACLCFNLQTVPSVDEANREYAGRLQTALERLGFPMEYVDSLL